MRHSIVCELSDSPFSQPLPPQPVHAGPQLDTIPSITASDVKQHILTSPNSSHFQSAYCHNHSTETALLYTLDHVYHYHTANAHESKILISFGLSACSLRHYRPLFNLIDRLQSTIGVFGAALLWITSYLTNRSHYIKLGNSSSDQMLITIGVPQ